MMVLSQILYGQTNYWNIDHSAFPNTMTIIAVVQIDEIEQRTSNIEIAAFFNEELRSDGVRLKYEESLDRYIAYIYLREEKDGISLTFKLYDHNIGEELDYNCLTTIEFINNATIGGVINPYVIEFETPIPASTFIGNGSWNEISNWNNSTLPTADNDVVIDGTAIISDEVNINSLIINEGKSLTIQNGGVLKVIGEIVNSDYNALIIEDGGQIIQTNKGVAATFKKNIVNPTSWSNPKSGWQFISSPMIDATTEDFVSIEGDYDLYKFDGTEDQQWINYKNHDDFENTFTSGVGYIASYETQITASFKGELYSETTYHDFPITFNSDNYWANFHLLGNPFSFDIVWEEDMSYNIKKMEDGFVTLNSTTGAYIYNVEGSIKVGEGFLICTNGKNPYLEFGEEAKSRNEKNDYINIIASNSNVSDNLIVRFGENESNGFPKLQNFNDEISTVYVNESGINYGIFNCNEVTKEIPFCFDAKEMGCYTLNFDVKGEFERLVLLDRMTGEKVNLLLENEYSFIAVSDDNAERFVLLMNDNGQQSTDNGHFAYINNGDIVIYDISGDADISIFDALGRCVYQGECSDVADRISTDGYSAGVYVIQKNDDKGINVQKIIL